MPDKYWFPAELVLPEQEQIVITYHIERWGLRKAYQSGGQWFDMSARPIDVHYWKPAVEAEEEDRDSSQDPAAEGEQKVGE